jgi:helix-turn-helix protein
LYRGRTDFYNSMTSVVESEGVAESAGDELDIRAAARLTGRSTETVRRWVWAGRLRARKRGTRLFVLRGDVEAITGSHGSRPLSLTEWRAEADSVVSRSATGRSASDLVLADRRERSSDFDARR